MTHLRLFAATGARLWVFVAAALLGHVCRWRYIVEGMVIGMESCANGKNRVYRGDGKGDFDSG
jgi:hypothetical protein